MAELDVITLGCRLNMVESEAMRRRAAEAGVVDAVIINTCAVTAGAVRDARKTIRRLRRERPTSRIIVTGCAAQIEPDVFAEMPEVDHVIGNVEKTKAETFWLLKSPDAPRVQVNDIMSIRETAGHLLDGFAHNTRGFVQVQNGCDHRCTFCIIPFGRGPSRSVPAGEVVAEVRRLVENGYAEAVLTGVDLTSYGADLPGAMTLGKLVRQILRHVPELMRLRLSSIDQVEADAELIAAIAEEPRLMPHFHLSLQSGDDMILKRMKRRHLRAGAIGFCERVRALRPDVVFGADLIAGFPTETDAMFANTLNLVDACTLTHLHVFPFSPRPGTPAARMPQVDRTTIKTRAAQLRRRGAAALTSYLDGQVGRTVDVLMERGGIGRTAQFAEVAMIEEQRIAPGRMTKSRLIGREEMRLMGEIAA